MRKCRIQTRRFCFWHALAPSLFLLLHVFFLKIPFKQVYFHSLIHSFITDTFLQILYSLMHSFINNLIIYLCMYCIALYCINGVVMAAQCTAAFLRSIILPNLGITRTWKCRLNFSQRSIFSGLRFFNEPEISDSGPTDHLQNTCIKSTFSWKLCSTGIFIN